MEKGNVKFAMNGEPGLLVLEVPSEIAPENVVHACLAIPLRQRSGGMLIAVPIDALDSDALVDEMSGAGMEFWVHLNPFLQSCWLRQRRVA